MMSFCERIAIGAVVAVALLGTASLSLAQEVEPPFTWKGEGQATFISEDGVNEIDFTLEMSVDANGGITGKTVSDEAETAVKHMFFDQRVDHGFRDYYSRKAILVLAINEQGNKPMLIILNGRLLGGRLFTGEVSFKRMEPGSDADRALGIGDPMATEIDEDNMPYSLKSALKKAMPVGAVKIEGTYQQ